MQRKQSPQTGFRNTLLQTEETPGSEHSRITKTRVLHYLCRRTLCQSDIDAETIGHQRQEDMTATSLINLTPTLETALET